MKIFLLFIWLILFSCLAFAETSHPCIEIAKVCKDAGYQLDTSTPNKNIWNDCVQPILDGKTISGVTIDAATVKACNDRKSIWQNKIENIINTK